MEDHIISSIGSRLNNFCCKGSVLMMEKQPTSQTEANKKWQHKNKEYANYLKMRSASRSFIKSKATLEDIEELKNLIKQREEFLNS